MYNVCHEGKNDEKRKINGLFGDSFEEVPKQEEVLHIDTLLRVLHEPNRKIEDFLTHIFSALLRLCILLLLHNGYCLRNALTYSVNWTLNTAVNNSVRSERMEETLAQFTKKGHTRHKIKVNETFCFFLWGSISIFHLIQFQCWNSMFMWFHFLRGTNFFYTSSFMRNDYAVWSEDEFRNKDCWESGEKIIMAVVFSSFRLRTEDDCILAPHLEQKVDCPQRNYSGNVKEFSALLSNIT